MVEHPTVDPHLLHLWDCRRGLTKRWKRQRLNRKLRARIEVIAQEANDYAQKLETENWLQLSDSLRGNLATKKTWNILRSMLDPAATKSESSRALATIVGEFQGTEGELIAKLKERYIGEPIIQSYSKAYDGPPNEILDAPITEAELFAATQVAKKNTAPGKDRLTNAMLRNINHEQIKKLTEYFNREVWPTGKIPEQWKEAEIILIPKPGKARNIQNLRPISLTSCLGKLFERVIHTRLRNYIEDNNLLSNYMYGFRPHLSTQDVFLRLKEEVLSHIPTGSEHLLAALDLKSAFDTIAHELILKELEKTRYDEKTYNYIRSFMANRAAAIGI